MNVCIDNLSVEIFCVPTQYKRLDGSYWICGICPEIPYRQDTFKSLYEIWDNQRKKDLKKHLESHSVSQFESIKITSHSDNTKKYEVKFFNKDRIECECKGFQFRKCCSHIDEVKKMKGLI